MSLIDDNMDRYALFAGSLSYGGWKDFVCSSNDVQELLNLIENNKRERMAHKWYLAKNDETWWHIVDLAYGIVVKDQNGDVTISTDLWMERG